MNTGFPGTQSGFKNAGDSDEVGLIISMLEVGKARAKARHDQAKQIKAQLALVGTEGLPRL
jgi:hypothetical protein